MAWDLNKQEIGTFRAGEDMSSARGKALVFNSLDRWQIAGTTGPLAGLVHGILTNTPISGEVASVQVSGVASVRLGGPITKGRYLDVDSNGDLVEFHPGGSVGIALDNGDVGDIIPVLLQLSNTIDVTVDNSIGTVYISGNEDTDEAWRLKVESAPERLSIEHREPLQETDINLTTTKVGNIISAGHSAASPFFGSVLTDSRTSQASPPGISGDMAGRIVSFDGFIWKSSVDQWFEKAAFEQSIFVDLGVYRRMNIIDSDPNDKTVYPPVPLEGTTIGARNQRADGLGFEMLSITNEQAFSAALTNLVHIVPDLETQDDVIDNLIGFLSDNVTIVSGLYESLHRTGTNYSTGDIVVQRGQYFVCNTNGIQNGKFTDFLDRWDLTIPNINAILVGDNGDVVTGDGENVVTAG